MGNDGGTINKGHNLQLQATDTKLNAKDDNLQTFKDLSEWRYCRLSNKRLQLPVMSDYKGHLFNKEAILEWLLTPDREDYSIDQIEKFSHIKKLTDVVELRNLRETVSGKSGDGKGYDIQCEYGEDMFQKSATKFVYLVPCGDVLPKSSLDMLPKSSLDMSLQRNCPNCDAPFQAIDIIIINPTSQEDVEALERRMETLKQQRKYHNGKVKKKAKKKRKNDQEPTPVKRMKGSV